MQDHYGLEKFRRESVGVLPEVEDNVSTGAVLLGAGGAGTAVEEASALRPAHGGLGPVAAEGVDGLRREPNVAADGNAGLFRPLKGIDAAVVADHADKFRLSERSLGFPVNEGLQIRAAA